MRLSIETHGRGEPIVFIHGMGSAATAWKPLIKLLKNDFQSITVDLPGHGKTPFSSSQAMDPYSLAKLVQKNLSALNIYSYHLVGNSLGGWVSLEMAAEFSKNVKSVIGLAPAGLWLTPFTSRYPGEVALRLVASGVNKLAPALLNYTWAKQIGFESVSPRW